MRQAAKGEVAIVEKLDELYKRSINRRSFLAGVGAVGAASAMAGCAGGTVVNHPTSGAVTDMDILNFALNLEYLEAEFYLRAATGNGLATADIGTNPGAVTGGAQVTGLSSAQQNILNEIAYDEQEHVRFLRSALGTAAVARPAIDLTNSFNALASAAGIGSTFNPFTNYDTFAVGAFVFEDVGVTAYSGAAPLISTAGIASGLLSAAAGILAVEAYHAAYIRTYLTAQAIATPSYAYLGYANKVSALRGTLGGGNENPLTVPTGTLSLTTVVTPSSIVAATTQNAIAFARTTDQVLHIVYGTLSNTAGATTFAAGVAKGAFFPNGLNGNITVTQS
jgi:Ferritin-like domain/TAT (twin-arginine translocation) pathway signal sequence